MYYAIVCMDGWKTDTMHHVENIIMWKYVVYLLVCDVFVVWVGLPLSLVMIDLLGKVILVMIGEIGIF